MVNIIPRLEMKKIRLIRKVKKKKIGHEAGSKFTGSTQFTGSTLSFALGYGCLFLINSEK